MISQLALLQPILIRNVADLPPEAEPERQFLERSGLASALIVPLAHNARLAGFLVIGWIRRDSVWKQNDIRALNMVGELISNALARAASGKSREALQAQLFQSQKVEAIGKLTGGVAHDFNNMLMPILGFTDLLLSRPPSEAADHEVLQQIRNAAESAATLASQLLAFSKKNILKRRAESLNAVVQKMERILDRVLGEDVELVTELAPDLRSAKLDVGQIEQILMNLALNSRAAMPGGGKLAIRTCNVAGAICGMEGNAVLLEICDTGVGMTPETLQQAFEPFFTTKGNQGTGLGLSVVQGIVEQHEGKIILDSQVGRGTTFHIFIPAETEQVAEAESSEKSVASNFLEIQRGAGRHALVIEDEESVCEFLRVILSGCGFTVSTASNGQEGMTAFAEADGLFDVIICDIVLPDVDGIELAKEFLQTSPEVPIIISTGHAERFVSLPNGSVHLLKKPYSLSELCRKLDAVLVAPIEAAA
jgi:signal transduction histidine kinase